MIGLAAALLASLGAAASTQPPEPKFVFDLATPTGVAESTWASIVYDREHDELFTIHEGMARVYNVAGMESFRFGGDAETGNVERLAVIEGGDLLLLTRIAGKRQIIRTDYRGERIGIWEPRPMPDGFGEFNPDRIVSQGGKVYLADSAAMRVVVADEQGKVERTIDLAAAVRARDPKIKIGMNGFWVDAQGAIYATMPYAFTAFVFPPAGEPRQFGTRGSSPGKFNIVGAIATDEKGTLFVLDRLRSVVMVFTPELKFVTEFGYRGGGTANMIAPYDLAVGNGKIFVSQARSKGVKVYQYDATWKPVISPGGRRG